MARPVLFDPPMRTLLVVCLGLFGVLGCGRSVAKDELPPPPPTLPLKLFIAVDGTQSFNISDPNGERAVAMISLINAQAAESSMLVSVFAGSTVAYLSPTGQPVFTRLTEVTASGRSQLEERLLTFSAPGTSVNRDATDFVTPLEAIRDAIRADLALGGSARYEVLFISDGGPTNNQDHALLCDGAVSELAALSNETNEVRVNTVFVNLVQVSACADSISAAACEIQPAASRCPASILAADEARLRRMADLGHGSFQSFRAGDTVDFARLLAH